MPKQPDVSASIRAFLLNHPGQSCEACLAKGAGLAADAVTAAFKPSRNNPYSFMPTSCSHCQTMAVCVAYVGEPDAASRKKALAALIGASP